MHVVLFEGSLWTDFAPLTLTRPVFMLRSGASTLLDKQLRATRPTRLSLWVRQEMVDYVRTRVVPTLSVPVTINQPLDDEPALLLSARTLHFSTMEQPQEQCVVVDDGLIKLAYVKSPGLSHDDVLSRSAKFKALHDLPNTMPQARFGRHWGDLVAWNEESLLTDSIHWNEPPPGGVACVRPESVHARKDVSIAPGVVLDATKGPILLDEGASIGANTVIEGPCYIGRNARVQALSNIRPGTTIGPVCRVGGEISNTIFQGYANKSHDGFLGDSYVGEWVNCGAGTTTSNLKSTYGEVRLTLGMRALASGRMLLGAALGDHAKTATHTQLPAGGYIGVASMIAVSHRGAKFTPSFRFVTDDSDEPIAVEKCCEIANRMQARREKSLDDVDKAILAYAAKIAPTVEK